MNDDEFFRWYHLFSHQQFETEQIKTTNAKDICRDLIKGMMKSYSECYDNGLINQTMSFDETLKITSTWAGKHVLLTEK